MGVEPREPDQNPIDVVQLPVHLLSATSPLAELPYVPVLRNPALDPTAISTGSMPS